MDNFECKKVKYSSEEFALFDIKRIDKKSDRETKPIRTYFCHCGSWHLTSKIDKKDQIISELRVEISDLKNEIEFLKNNREDTIEIRKDKRIIELQKGLETSKKRTTELKKINIELICELIQIKKKYEQ